MKRLFRALALCLLCPAIARAQSLDECLAGIEGTRGLAGMNDPAAGVHANAHVTCDDQNRVCCDSWVIDINHRKSGIILEPTFADLQSSLQKSRRDDERFCRYFGSDDSSCHVEYGPPHCNGTEDPSAPLELPKDLESARNLVKQVSERVDRAQRDYQVARQQLAELTNGLDMNPSAKDFEDAGPGFVVGQYGDALEDATRKAHALENCLRDVPDGFDWPSFWRNPYWRGGPDLWRGGSGGGFGGHDEQAARLSRLFNVIDTIDGQLRRVRITGPESIDFAGGGTVRSRTHSTAFGKFSIGKLGDPGEGETVPGSELPAIFLVRRPGKPPVLGKITVTREPYQSGERITLVGKAGDDTETIVILVGKRKPQPRSTPREEVARAPSTPPPRAAPTPIGRCADLWSVSDVTHMNCHHVRGGGAPGLLSADSDVWCKTQEEASREMDGRCADPTDYAFGNRCVRFRAGEEPAVGQQIGSLESDGSRDFCVP